MRIIYLFLAFNFITIQGFGQIKESAAVDSIFAEWDTDNSPGCGLGIIKDGNLIYGRGYGMANLEYDIPNTEKSVFRIGSTSKQFTAACIMHLAEQGKLNLDDKLSSFYPDFPKYADTITVAHLVNHTSGIRDYLQLSYLKGLGDDDYYQDSDIMKWLVNQTDLNFSPGEEFLYSNSGYWLLGQIVNKTAGMNMADYAKQEIFEPLGMANTHFHNNHRQIVKNRASGYYPNEKGGYDISMTTLDMIGDGGIFTTIEDIKKWDDAYYSSETLSPEFWDMMTTQGTLNDGKQITYASGLMIKDYKGLKTISHGGAFVGFRAELLRFPDQKFSVAIFTNRGDANPSRMALEVADIFLSDQYQIETKQEASEQETPSPPVTKIAIEQIVGNYEVQAGLILEVTQINDSLHVFQSWNKSEYNIVNTTGNTYQIPNEQSLSFTFSDVQSNATQVLTILQEGTETKAKRKEKTDLSSTDHTEYQGSFYSSELDVRYDIKVMDSTLKLRVNENPYQDLEQTDIDSYSSEMGMIKFLKVKNTISGFELNSGRVKNVQFTKMFSK